MNGVSGCQGGLFLRDRMSTSEVTRSEWTELSEPIMHAVKMSIGLIHSRAPAGTAFVAFPSSPNDTTEYPNGAQSIAPPAVPFSAITTHRPMNVFYQLMTRDLDLLGDQRR